MALLALMLAVTACSQDEPLPAPDRPGADSVTTFLRMSLQLPVESAPRSNPSGGEEGDGRLPGINNENTIHDISIFIYSHDLGLDCPAETPVAVKLHFTEPELRAYKVKDTQNTYLLPLGDIDPVGCRIAVAANIGFLPRDITTMGQLRTHICQRSFMAGDLVDGTSQAISGADRFVMSNAYNGAKSGNLDGFIVIPQGDRPGSEQNPLTAEVWLERMAARIDLLLKDENIRGPFPVADGFLRYDVTENGKRIFDKNWTRLLRRCVRDLNYRGFPIEETLSLWDNVRLGESLYITPYVDRADITMDTSLAYEVPVLAAFAAPYFADMKVTVPQAELIRKILAMLEKFERIDPALVPESSLLREEFIK